MNQLDKQYQELLFDIIENGVNKDTRNGKTRSVFGKQIRHKMKEGFPLLTTKKMYWKGIVTELMWFLRGDTNIKFLVDNDCHIWDGDAYKNWCKQFEVDPNNFDGDEIAKGHNDQCWGYPILDHVKSTSKEYKRGQINAYLEGKAEKPFFYLTQEEFINKIKTDEEFAEMWGELGPIYGKQWRSWKAYRSFRIEEGGGDYSIEHRTSAIDQIANLINDLKTNPDSRRLMVSAWNVGELDSMTLPPCHYGFQVYTRELSLEERIQQIPFSEKHTIHERNECIDDLRTLKGDELKSFEQYIKQQCDSIHTPTRAISLMWNQRSVDTFLGLPFNIASYGLLLEIIAKEVNMVPDELIGNLGDVHLYENHLPQSREQLVREPYALPKLKIDDQYWVDDCGLDTHILSMLIEDFQIENYQSHPSIKAPLSN
jgi:thymidylate synthase